MAESRCRGSSEAGFSLAETIVATGIMLTGLIAAAQLFTIAMSSNMASKTQTFAAVLAHEKMEQLRSLTWGFDNVGLPVSDYTSNITVDPPTATGGLGLTPSPANSLTENVDGYVDYVDADGVTLGGGVNPEAGTAYVRRWSVEPLPTNPNNTLILQVFVFKVGTRGDDPDAEVIERRPDEARLMTVKTRKSP
ncbi:MAG: hypothetical protein AB1635_07525 [Acidobacteriota bacterium]